MTKKCPPGQYYCFDDKKCKKIPRGYRIGARGYLARDTKDDDNETKKNGNGNSNGNGTVGMVLEMVTVALVVMVVVMAQAESGNQ